MRAEASLRGRIVQACVLLAAGLCCVYAVLFMVGVGVVEDKLLDNRMLAAAGGLIRNRLQAARGPVESDPKVYQDEQIPPPMRGLQDGMHELAFEGRILHVLLRAEQGHRFAVVEDESDFERIEGFVRAVLAGTFVLCVALAWALGASTAARVIKPVADLSRAVDEHRLGEPLPALARGDEVGVLARALAAHHGETQGFLDRERLFTGDVSHELRTPLTVMLGAAEVLTARLAGEPELLPFADRIRRTALETSDRVTALLLLSRAPQSMERPRVDLARLLQQEVERCRPALEGKAVSMQLRIEEAAEALGRPELMSIAFGNLIRNACSFTETGFVRVTLRRGQVLVEDSGVGIPPDLRDQVFERFVSTAAAASGSGLGLAIVQRVCEHLGWTVQLTASGPAGSSFVVTIPPAGESQPRDAAVSYSAAPP